MASQPALYDHVIYRGDDYAETFEFTDVAGAAENLTGCTYLAQIREDPDDTTTLASFTVITTDLALGKVTLTLPAATTAALVNGVWDLQETHPTYGKRTRLKGAVIMNSDVSR